MIEAGDWSRFTSLTALFVFMSGRILRSHSSLPRFLSRNAIARFSEPGLLLNPDFNTLSLRNNKIAVVDASFVPSSGLSLHVCGNSIERIS
jgi:Leucine-rich repeat (LRR) protein